MRGQPFHEWMSSGQIQDTFINRELELGFELRLGLVQSAIVPNDARGVPKIELIHTVLGGDCAALAFDSRLHKTRDPIGGANRVANFSQYAGYFVRLEAVLREHGATLLLPLAGVLPVGVEFSG